MWYTWFVRKQFRFLRRLGFKVRVYSEIREGVDEFLYSTKQIEIVITRINRAPFFYEYHWKDTDDMLNHAIHETTVIIGKGDKDRNIFDLVDVFCGDELKELKLNIQKLENDKNITTSLQKHQRDEEIIKLYANFLSKNIHKLIDT